MSNLSTAQRLEVSETEVAALTGQLATASADLTAALASVETLKGTVSAHEATIAAHVATIASLTEANATTSASLASTKSENEALAAKEQDIEKRATAKAASVAAVIGATTPLPITASGGTSGSGVSKLTRSQFNSLSQIEKNKFMAGGGKLTE